MKIKTLDNGIRVIAEKVPFFHSASVGVWIKAGSRYESAVENGISHFIEHMLFKGTKTRTAKQIASEIDNIGGTLNAFTAKECTCYYVHVMDEHISIGIKLLADMLKNSLFDEKEIKKEQSVVCEEIAMVDDTPDDLVHEIAAKGIFGANPLGQTILGSKENVRSFDRDAILQYMGKHYVAENIVVSVAGNIDENDVINLINDEFSEGIMENTADNIILDRAIYAPKKIISVYKDNEQMNMCISYEGVGSNSEYFYPLTVFNGLFGGSMSSRLFQSIREENGLTYSIFSYQSTYNDCGIYSIYAGMSPEQTSRVIELIREQINIAINEKLSLEELNAAKEQIKGSLILGTEGARAIMSRNGKMLLIKNKTDSIEDIITNINCVNCDDVHDVVSNIFNGKKCYAFVGKKEFIPQNYVD